MLHEQKILVIQPGNSAESLRMGIEQVRSRFPMAQIEVLCAASLSQVALSMRDVNQVLLHCAIAETGVSDVPERMLSLIALLKAERFDIAIVLRDEDQSPYPFAYACYLANIPVRLGVSCEFGGGVLSVCGAGVKELLDRVQEAA